MDFMYLMAISFVVNLVINSHHYLLENTMLHSGKYALSNEWRPIFINYCTLTSLWRYIIGKGEGLPEEN